MIKRNSFVFMNFSLNIINFIRSLDFEDDDLTIKVLHKNQHPLTDTRNKEDYWILRSVIIRQGTVIFKLFTSKDKRPMMNRNFFLIITFSLNIKNSVRLFNFNGDGFSSKGLLQKIFITLRQRIKSNDDSWIYIQPRYSLPLAVSLKKSALVISEIPTLFRILVFRMCVVSELSIQE